MEESNFSGRGGGKLTSIHCGQYPYMCPNVLHPQTIFRVGDRNQSQIKVHSVVNRYKFSQEMFSTIKVNLKERMGTAYMISYVGIRSS